MVSSVVMVGTVRVDGAPPPRFLNCRLLRDRHVVSRGLSALADGASGATRSRRGSTTRRPRGVRGPDRCRGRSAVRLRPPRPGGCAPGGGRGPGCPGPCLARSSAPARSRALGCVAPPADRQRLCRSGTAPDASVRRDPLRPDRSRRAATTPSAVDDHDQLDRGFQRLKPHHRAAIVLHFYLDLSVPDVADALGVPVGTAKSRIHYAVEALRAALEADERAPIATTRELTR